MISEPLRITLLVTDVLDALGVAYFVGGSVASALYGAARSTLDSDLVADLKVEHASPLVHMLAATFYADEVSIREAIERRSSFNLIHLDTSFKVDVFVRRARPFDDSQFQRRRAQTIANDPDRSVVVASAEDSVLAKLEWYRMGGDVSDRQWRDILGMLIVRAGRLDSAYLAYWAEQLGVADLLARALQESGGA
jgi:hypothetical protein